ncbi:MAG: rRNA maturation RNase YbeY, partial [Eubacteriales bacterium]|nr:rRNA maturation RNase YbeY [Eubacteriales bacterium]
MVINFSDDQDTITIPNAAIALLKKGLRAVAKLHKLSAKTEVSVTLVNDEVIRVLNKNYRGIDQPTDVLSFALDEGEDVRLTGGPEEHLLGDIIISAEAVVRQGKAYGHGLNRELVYLGVHSMLHLLGYDHMQKTDKVKMRAAEEEALATLNLSQAQLDTAEARRDPLHFADTLIDKELITKARLAEDTTDITVAKKRLLCEKENGKKQVGQQNGKEVIPDKILQRLFKAALKTRENAYAPYSHFQVGAALLTTTGKLFTGCNVENSSFGLTICAEQNVIHTAVAAGYGPGQLDILLVVADTEQVTSCCGACRQVMAEFDIRCIVLANT